MNQSFNSFNVLTSREIEIVKLVSQGFTSKEIGKVLQLSIFTIETHRRNILKKLNLKKTTALVNFYFNYAPLIN